MVAQHHKGPLGIPKKAIGFTSLGLVSTKDDKQTALSCNPNKSSLSEAGDRIQKQSQPVATQCIVARLEDNVKCAATVAASEQFKCKVCTSSKHFNKVVRIEFHLVVPTSQHNNDQAVTEVLVGQERVTH